MTNCFFVSSCLVQTNCNTTLYEAIPKKEYDGALTHSSRRVLCLHSILSHFRHISLNILEKVAIESHIILICVFSLRDANTRNCCCAAYKNQYQYYNGLHMITAPNFFFTKLRVVTMGNSVLNFFFSFCLRFQITFTFYKQSD